MKREQIIDILAKFCPLPIWYNEFADEIRGVEPLDCEQCKAYKELIEAQEELVSCLEREISIASFDGCDLDQHLVACYNTENAQNKIAELKQLINDK